MNCHHKALPSFPVLLHPETYPQNISKESHGLQHVVCIYPRGDTFWSLTFANLSAQTLGITDMKARSFLKHYLKIGPALASF